jgi:hypothetical protein
LLFLQALQNRLVLESYSEEFFLALVTVEAGLGHLVCLEQVRLVTLHYVRHLLQQNAVLSLDFSISAWQGKGKYEGTYAQASRLFWRFSLDFLDETAGTRALLLT